MSKLLPPSKWVYVAVKKDEPGLIVQHFTEQEPVYSQNKTVRLIPDDPNRDFFHPIEVSEQFIFRHAEDFSWAYILLRVTNAVSFHDLEKVLRRHLNEVWNHKYNKRHQLSDEINTLYVHQKHIEKLLNQIGFDGPVNQS